MAKDTVKKAGLPGVTRSTNTKPPRIIIYGSGGIGKSTFGAMAPNPIFLPIEDGLGELEVDHFPLITSYEELLNALAVIFTEDHDFKTVVIDSLDWLERLVWQKVALEQNVKSIESIGFAKGYIFALEYWREVISALDALRDHKNMMVIVISHAQIKRFDSPTCDPYDRYMMKLHDKARDLMFEWADATLFAGYKVHTKSTEVKGGQKIVRGIGDSQRALYTTEAPGWLAKNRYNLPPELPLDFSAFMEALTAK